MTAWIARGCLVSLLVTFTAAPTTAQTEIVLPTPDGALGFGQSVDIKTDYAVVGAPLTASGRGAAYVYRYDDAAGWVLDATLLAPDGVAGDDFGVAVAIGSGPRVAVGAPDAGLGQDGTVYVFRRDAGGTWAVEQTFVDKELGRLVAFDENVLASATGRDGGSVTAETWRRTGTTWAPSCPISRTADNFTRLSLDLPYLAYHITGSPTGSEMGVLELPSCQTRPTPIFGTRIATDEGRLAIVHSSPYVSHLVLHPTPSSPGERILAVGGGTEQTQASFQSVALRRGYLAATATYYYDYPAELHVLRDDSTSGWSVFQRTYPRGSLTHAVALSGRFVLVGGTQQAFLLDLATLSFRARPALYAPADDATDQGAPLAFAWGAVDYAQSYTLEVNDDSLFTSTGRRLESGLLDTTFVVEDGLASDQTYYWRVRGEQTDDVGPWSRVRSFSTALTDTAPPPALTVPANGAANLSTTIIFVWEAAASADDYQIQVATDAAFSDLVFDARTAALFRTVSGLIAGETYHWRVRSGNAVGLGAWSPIRTFSTAPAAPVAPTLSIPADGATGVPTNAVFAWGPPSQNATYTLHVSTSADFSVLVVDATVPDTTYQATGLQELRQHYWRVRAQNAVGTTAWSATSTFATAGTVGTEDAPPTVFALSEPQPNPSSSTVAFRLDVPAPGPVRLAVFDALGREVAVLLDGEVAAGTHPVSLDASALPAGIYVARLIAGETVLTRRLVVAR